MSHQEHNVGSFAHLFQHCRARFANKINTKAKSLKRTEVIIVSFNFFILLLSCTSHLLVSTPTFARSALKDIENHILQSRPGQPAPVEREPSFRLRPQPSKISSAPQPWRKLRVMFIMFSVFVYVIQQPWRKWCRKTVSAFQTTWICIVWIVLLTRRHGDVTMLFCFATVRFAFVTHHMPRLKDFAIPKLLRETTLLINCRFNNSSFMLRTATTS